MAFMPGSVLDGSGFTPGALPSLGSTVLVSLVRRFLCASTPRLSHILALFGVYYAQEAIAMSQDPTTCPRCGYVMGPLDDECKLANAWTTIASMTGRGWRGSTEGERNHGLSTLRLRDRCV